MTQKISEADTDRGLQDQAYDLLGEMLVERDTARYMNELETDVVNGNTAEMDAFFAKMDKINLRKIESYGQKQRNKYLFLHTLPRLAQAAAVMIAVVALAGGIALATSHTVRVQVMRLLLNVEKEYTELSLIEDENASFDVPAEWEGSCFPSYIPEELEVVQCLSSGNDNYILYFGMTDETTQLDFSENSSDRVTNIDTEDAAVRSLMINGNSGYISTKQNTIQIFWSDGIHYFIVSTKELGEEITIQIAQSVRKIK